MDVTAQAHYPPPIPDDPDTRGTATRDALADAPPRGRAAALWFGIIAPPAAELLNLAIGYPVVPWACARTDHVVAQASLHVVPLLLLVVSIGAGFVAWHARRREHPSGRGAPLVANPDFMALWGVGMSVLFSITIVAQYLPVFFLPPCMHA